MVMPRISLVMNVGCLAVAISLAGTGQLMAQTGAALTGKVTDGHEALEGVLVSAKRGGSTVTVTVVTGKDGGYSFPAGRLEPGQYSLRIRATGYDLDSSGQVLVTAEKTATADLALRKAEDIAPQLTNAEWLASMPGTDAQ
jgi:virginiamycin B lyase